MTWLFAVSLAHPGCPEAWTSFRWSDPDKGAMMVPATVNGKEAWFQFDTGADVTILYGDKIARKLGVRAEDPSPPNDRDWRRAGSLAVGGATLTDRRILVFDDMGRGSTAHAGTIGADVLEGRVLVIDFPNERFAVLEPERARDLPGHFTAAALRRTKLFVPVEVDGKTYPNLFFDSGSSTFDIWVDREIWSTWTGRKEPYADDPVIEGHRWGKLTRWPGAPVPSLTIAGVRVVEPTAYFMEGEPVFAGTPHRADGLFGSRPFLDRVVVADFSESPRFGFADCR